jgi:hypothetical protein
MWTLRSCLSHIVFTCSSSSRLWSVLRGCLKGYIERDGVRFNPVAVLGESSCDVELVMTRLQGCFVLVLQSHVIAAIFFTSRKVVGALKVLPPGKWCHILVTPISTLSTKSTKSTDRKCHFAEVFEKAVENGVKQKGLRFPPSAPTLCNFR